MRSPRRPPESNFQTLLAPASRILSHQEHCRRLGARCASGVTRRVQGAWEAGLINQAECQALTVPAQVGAEQLDGSLEDSAIPLAEPSFAQLCFFSNQAASSKTEFWGPAFRCFMPIPGSGQRVSRPPRVGVPWPGLPESGAPA